MRPRALARLAAVASLVLVPSAFAQTGYPARPVRMIVSYAAGNVTDLLARLVAERLSERWGQQVVVDNRPGTGGSTGAQAAAKAPADGYTLLFSAMAAMAVNPHAYASVGYDPLRDFTTIVNVAFPNSLLFVAPSLPVATFPALVAHSKTTRVFFASAGNGTIPHLNMELLKREAGLVAEHVPYKGAVAALTDLMAGRIQAQSEAVAVVLPHVKAGKVKAIAAMTERRVSQLPDLPAIGETVPGFVPFVPWLGIMAPAGIPADVVRKINADVNAMIGAPAVKEKLESFGLEAIGGSPEDFDRRLRADHARLGKLVREMKLSID